MGSILQDHSDLHTTFNGGSFKALSKCPHNRRLLLLCSTTQATHEFGASSIKFQDLGTDKYIPMYRIEIVHLFAVQPWTFFLHSSIVSSFELRSFNNRYPYMLLSQSFSWLLGFSSRQAIYYMYCHNSHPQRW
jgi:hypothetical protein